MKGFMFESYYFLFQNCTPPNPNMNSNNNPDEKGKSYSGLACLHVDVSFFWHSGYQAEVDSLETEVKKLMLSSTVESLGVWMNLWWHHVMEEWPKNLEYFVSATSPSSFTVVKDFLDY